MEVWMMVNVNSGRRQGRQAGERIRRALALSGHQVKAAYTASLEEASDFLAQAGQRRPELLLCCGGDGTLSFAAGALRRLDAGLPLGYVPLGTTNDYAASLGLPKDPVAAARQAVEGSLHRLDAGGFGEREFLYVASFGAFTQSSYKAPGKRKAALGHLAYLLEGARELPALRPICLQAEVEGELFEGEFLFGAVSNTRSLGGVVRMDPELVALDDGLLELTLVSMPQSPWELGQLVGSLSQGRLEGELVTRRQVRRVQFVFPQKVDWSLDGEYAPGEEAASLAVLPQALPLMY